MRAPEATHSGREPSTLPASGRSRSDGRLGRLGRWAGAHRRNVVVGWAGLLICLGVLAPRAEHALSGGGWQADGSESVQAPPADRPEFSAGRAATRLPSWSSSRAQTVGGPRFRATMPGRRGCCGAIRLWPAVRLRARPVDRAGRPCGRRPRRRGSRRRRRWCGPRAACARASRRRRPGASRCRSPARPRCGRSSTSENRAAMLRSEMMSWPLTLAVLAVAFGHLRRPGSRCCLPSSGWSLPPARSGSAPAHRYLDLGDEFRPDVRARGRHRLCAVRRRALPGGAAGGPARRSMRSPRRWTAPARRCSSAGWP